MSFAAVLKREKRRGGRNFFIHNPIIKQNPEGLVSPIRSKTTAASLNAKALKSAKNQVKRPATPPSPNSPSAKASSTINIPDSKAKTSKILSEVREISTGSSKKNTGPVKPSTTPKSASPNQSKPSTIVGSKAAAKSPPNPVTIPTTLPRQTTPPQLSQKSQRPGKKPKGKSNDKPLQTKKVHGQADRVRSSPKYKKTSRKVTLAIVALPIALVTSWMLYQRLVLGEKRKELVPPGVSRVEEKPASD
ncbi:hypothetical protein K3495_g1053 [Podosphaera aphanis]|nr:hypothetical protein K3495_g1053 [Podosphaera aphanis]